MSRDPPVFFTTPARDFHRVNSEQIRARFGSYAVRVLHQDEHYRLANLCSHHDGVDICRTLAVTHFMMPAPAPLSEVDTLIRQGQSIGSTLKDAGLALSRNMLAEGHTSCGDGFSRVAGDHALTGSELVVRLYELFAGPEESSLELYATIAEAHHPQHVPVDDDMPDLADIPSGNWGENARVALEQLLAAVA
ncbi:MAG: hypothetical protein CME55_03085 [Halieaceae bacterium]|nr:hypothetical protein [Halieaceae bacterium]